VRQCQEAIELSLKAVLRLFAIAKKDHIPINDCDYSFNVRKLCLSKIKTIKVPTLILTGDKDIFIPPPESEKMHQLIPGSKLVKFAPKIGHMIQYEALNDYHKALEDFFKTL